MSAAEKKKLQEHVRNNLNKFQVFFYEYGRFHYNFTNIIIHIIFVPIITITFDRIFGLLGEKNNLSFNPFYILYLIVTFLYLYVDIFAGLITAIQYPLIGYLLTFIKFEIFGFSQIQSYLFINIFSWIAQFLGHGLFEKRKPALMENIFLTLNAPCFVNIELFNFLFNYRKKELEEVRVFIVKDIAIYKKMNDNDNINKSQ
jgi:uncharacterized membrane protein YGL010W